MEDLNNRRRKEADPLYFSPTKANEFGLFSSPKRPRSKSRVEELKEESQHIHSSSSATISG